MYGLTVEELFTILEEMRGIYPYKNDKTRVTVRLDCATNEYRMVELVTVDEKTGVTIHMSKKGD